MMPIDPTAECFEWWEQGWQGYRKYKVKSSKSRKIGKKEPNIICTSGSGQNGHYYQLYRCQICGFNLGKVSRDTPRRHKGMCTSVFNKGAKQARGWGPKRKTDFPQFKFCNCAKALEIGHCKGKAVIYLVAPICTYSQKWVRHRSCALCTQAGAGRRWNTVLPPSPTISVFSLVSKHLLKCPRPNIQ